MTAPTATLSDRLEELVRRVEALSGPCREIDAEIAIAVAVVPEGAFRPCAAIDAGTFATGPHSFWSCEPYTKSIDAAMTLVPPGLVYNLGNDTAFCWAHAWDDTPDYDGEPYEGRASTLPCAIVASALRALATLQGGEG